jgi:hypothetical protein
MLPVLAVLWAAQLVYASPPSDAGSFPLSAVPDCVATAPDTGGAHICKVRAAVGGQWQAGTGEWIVIRAAKGSTTQAGCLTDTASIVPTITIDGNSLPVDTIPCELNVASGLWFIDYRALSHPLPPGDHAIVESWYFTTNDGSNLAGTTITFNATLTVAQHG